MNYDTEYVLFRIGVLNSQQTLATESQYTFMKTPSIRRQCITLECVAMAGWRDISLTSGHPHTSSGVHLYSILWSHETLLYHFTLLLAYLISILVSEKYNKVHFSMSMSKPCDKYIHHYFQFPMWLDCILCQITIILRSVHYYIHNKNCVNANTRTKNELYVKIFFQIHKFICKDKYISCLWAKSKSWTHYTRHRLHLSNLVE